MRVKGRINVGLISRRMKRCVHKGWFDRNGGMSTGGIDKGIFIMWT
jgi:hypothetical protein